MSPRRRAQAVIPHLPALFDEPFSDLSQIPTFLISELARRHVTVSLSGDGGDELFGGYNRYTWVQKIWNSMGWLPNSLRSFGSAASEPAASSCLERYSFESAYSISLALF